MYEFIHLRTKITYYIIHVIQKENKNKTIFCNNIYIISYTGTHSFHDKFSKIILFYNFILAIEDIG